MNVYDGQAMPGQEDDEEPFQMNRANINDESLKYDDCSTAS